MRRLVRLGLTGLSLAVASVPVLVSGCGDKNTIFIYPEGGPGSGGASGSPGSGGSNAGTGGAPTSGGSGPSSGGESGSTGTGGTGGTPTTGGAAGSAGAGGGMSCGPGEGLGIAPTNGLYDVNCVGIAGSAYSYVDDMGSYVTVTSDDGHFCISGMLGDSANGAWGGAIEYQLNAPGGASPVPYDATAHGVTGFSFDITGPQIPSTLQIHYAVDGDGQVYCEELAAGHHDVAFSEAYYSCGSSGSTPNPAALVLIRFAFYSVSGATIPLDFCVDNLTATQ
jgi:hypothetical protein